MGTYSSSSHSDSTILDDSNINTDFTQKLQMDQLREKLSTLKVNQAKEQEQEQHRHHKPSNSSVDPLDDSEDIVLIKGLDIITNKTTNPDDNEVTPSDSTIFSPSSVMSSSSSNIFERSVQDQGSIPSMSRRDSFNKMGALQRTLSFSLSQPQPLLHQHSNHSSSTSASGPNNSSSIPSHLNAEDFIPTCLDASTEILTDDNADLSNVDIIQSTNGNLTDYLDQTFYHKKKKPIKPTRTRAASLTRKQSVINAISAPLSPINQKETDYSTDEDEELDYAEKKRLNFRSFADMINDEFESTQISRVNTNSSNFSSTFTMSPMIKTASKNL